jgi:hypothetical protein
MRARHLVLWLGLGLAIARPAAAESHKLLVLQSEGRADAATRAKIDAAIVKLALAAEPQTTAGELNYSDAATAVGCKPAAAACKDEVIGMLGVDEIVITTVTPKPGGIEVTVRRVGKGGASNSATMLIATGAPPDKLDGIAPLFGGKPAAPEAPAASATAPTEHASETPPVIPAPTAATESPSPAAAPMATDQAKALPVDKPSTGRHRLEIAGMVGGAGMVVLGVVFWGAAKSVQSDIDNAPTTTKQNLTDLKDLEDKGDRYAAFGNLLAIGGLVVGGISTYFYIKDRRAPATSSARLMPAVLDRGAGLVFTIGGSP